MRDALGGAGHTPASYRFFVLRRLFLRVGSAEKVAEVRSAGSIGAALTVVLTLTFPEGVNVVFVRMRMDSSFRRRLLHAMSLPESTRKVGGQSCYPDPRCPTSTRFPKASHV